MSESNDQGLRSPKEADDTFFLMKFLISRWFNHCKYMELLVPRGGVASFIRR
jgi:hypothetical protein